MKKSKSSLKRRTNVEKKRLSGVESLGVRALAPLFAVIRLFRERRSNKRMFRNIAGGVGATALAVILAVAIAKSQANEPTAHGVRVSDRKLVCMLQDSLQTREGLEYAYNGKKYYLCCAGCRAGFEENPTRYSHASDPVNGEQVDKADAPIYGYKGRAYFFSSQKTLQMFAQDPERYLRQARAAENSSPP